MPVQMSETDLLNLSKQTNVQYKKLLDIINELTTTMSTSTGGTAWESTAAQSLQQLWRTNSKVLNSLADDLNKWSGYCQKQAGIARDLNKVF